MIPLENTPYLLNDETLKGIVSAVRELQERVKLLRQQGKLTPTTLAAYYGSKRFEQVAESNAIEGSTLSVGETELAILKGVTFSGHDPVFVKDALLLNNALDRLVDLAGSDEATDITQLLEIHQAILGDRPGAGMFRSVPVIISGAEHRPPKTWSEVMNGMEAWEKWSKQHHDTAAVVRGVVLHAWMSHVHPFVDGNGRTARAITNLELVRQGLPPIIIRRKERDRYIDALARSDEAGNIGPFFELVMDRSFDALHALERAAKQGQGYDPLQAKLRQSQEQRLKIWNTSISLLYEMILDRLRTTVEKHNGRVQSKIFSEAMALDDYVDLCSGISVSRSWAFKVRIDVPGLQSVERLAWIGFRSDVMKSGMAHGEGFGPSVFWSVPTVSYPYWKKCTEIDAPGPVEVTIRQGFGDEWYRLRGHEGPRKSTTSALAQEIATGFVDLVVKGS